MSEAFIEDLRVQQVAEAYSLDAVDFAKSSFSLILDWSDASVRHVETTLGRLHEDLPSAKSSEEQILGFAKMFGSYVGEVHRKNHGSSWGMITLNGESFPGMRATTGKLFWPWGRAQNRIVDGPENNMWHYYQFLVGGPELLAGASFPPATSQSAPNKPWWRRILGG
jgi:hypothetical protein